jgi:hypothetical protein
MHKVLDTKSHNINDLYINNTRIAKIIAVRKERKTNAKPDKG